MFKSKHYHVIMDGLDVHHITLLGVPVKLFFGMNVQW